MDTTRCFVLAMCVQTVFAILLLAKSMPSSWPTAVYFRSSEHSFSIQAAGDGAKTKAQANKDKAAAQKAEADAKRAEAKKLAADEEREMAKLAKKKTAKPAAPKVLAEPFHALLPTRASHTLHTLFSTLYQGLSPSARTLAARLSNSYHPALQQSIIKLILPCFSDKQLKEGDVVNLLRGAPLWLPVHCSSIGEERRLRGPCSWQSTHGQSRLTGPGQLSKRPKNVVGPA